MTHPCIHTLSILSKYDQKKFVQIKLYEDFDFDNITRSFKAIHSVAIKDKYQEYQKKRLDNNINKQSVSLLYSQTCDHPKEKSGN